MGARHTSRNRRAPTRRSLRRTGTLACLERALSRSWRSRQTELSPWSRLPSAGRRARSLTRARPSGACACPARQTHAPPLAHPAAVPSLTAQLALPLDEQRTTSRASKIASAQLHTPGASPPLCPRSLLLTRFQRSCNYWRNLYVSRAHVKRLTEAAKGPARCRASRRSRSVRRPPTTSVRQPSRPARAEPRHASCRLAQANCSRRRRSR